LTNIIRLNLNTLLLALLHMV